MNVKKNACHGNRKNFTIFKKGKKNPTLGAGEKLSVRAAAAEMILKMLDQGKSLSTLLPEYQNRIDAKDVALLQELVFGVARVLPRLESVIRKMVAKPLKGKTRIVHCLLLVGLYQILYTRIPPFAAVDEVVNACESLKVPNFRGLMNGVLRQFLRDQENILDETDKHNRTLHPDWLVNLLKAEYPNWQTIIEANNQKPPMWLRVREGVNREAYQLALAEKNIATLMGEHPQALRLEEACSVEKLVDFEKGSVTVQDLHAQWAATLLNPQNEERILDACAAPGGKTTHLLELAPKAKITALDVEASRLKRVEENLKRMNQQAEIICADACDLSAWMGSEKFDKILLDAPCSATGVIRRHPDIKWLRQAEDIENLSALQGKILRTLWQSLKPGGELLYATCSVLPQENRLQIEKFLAEQKDAALIALPFENAEIGKQFLPTAFGGDGFYYAKLRKKA